MDLLRLPAGLRCVALPRTLNGHIRCRGIATESFMPFSMEPTLAAPPPPTSLSNSSRALLALQSATLNLYSVSHAPNPAQLRYSNTFFASTLPHLLFSAAQFRSLPLSPHPEVAFLGRSNVGKSSLLNALFNRTSERVAHVSKRPGRTRTMNGFGVGGQPFGMAAEHDEKSETWRRMGRGGVVVVDMPGYGGGSREEWGNEIMKYLVQRKQLRRTFLLVDAEHGLKNSDIELLTYLGENGISHQIILSKVDKLLYPGAKAPSPQTLSNRLLKLRETCRGLEQQLQPGNARARSVMRDVLCCSAEKSLDTNSRRAKLGIDELRWAVLSAAGLECDERGETKRYGLDDVEVLEEDT